ncbi:uncharacterized protein LOC131245077 [Magnolia sinica]|uniref:uncharacterized protein LOC131245077 n=1 Tax=Magnolia sinica TaxID=86752 RepID=UPI0026594D40|nr:uncharacterized protein LOC131245077 [Magnolia sinica]
MGFVLVISLPLILFAIVLGFGCYFLGRAKGRQDVRTCPQVYGEPVPPKGGVETLPPTIHVKQDNSMQV